MAYRLEWDQGRSGSMGFLRGGPAPATTIIIIACVAVFVVQFVLSFIRVGQPLMPGMAPESLDDRLVTWLGLSVGSAPFLVPFVTYMFLHSAPDPWHLIWNMLGLFFFGRELEISLGTRRYLGVYFGAGILGGLCYVIFSALMGTWGPVVGASAGVLGVIVYFALLFPHRPVILLFIPMKAWHLAALFVGVDVLRFFAAVMGGAGFAVAWAAHLGGAAWLANMKRRAERAKLRRHQQEKVDESREMDRILQKIHREGLQSLNEKEKRFLDRVSKDLKGRH
jgi:membrane associated rhomboid family serine protease